MISWRAMTGSGSAMCTSSSVHCGLLVGAIAPVALTTESPAAGDDVELDADWLAPGSAAFVAVWAPCPVTVLCVPLPGEPARDGPPAPDGRALAAGSPPLPVA